VIDTLAQGAMGEVTGEVTGRDWYRVSLRDGAIGYVWSKLLAPAVQPVAQ